MALNGGDQPQRGERVNIFVNVHSSFSRAFVARHSLIGRPEWGLKNVSMDFSKGESRPLALFGRRDAAKKRRTTARPRDQRRYIDACRCFISSVTASGTQLNY